MANAESFVWKNQTQCSKPLCGANMAFYCICKLLGRSQISEGGFGPAPTMSKNCKFFRWRDKEEFDPSSKFILPNLVNKIKELEEEVLRSQTQINEQVIDNNNGVGSIGRCRFYWKIILCVLICVDAMFINNLFQSSELSIDLVELA